MAEGRSAPSLSCACQLPAASQWLSGLNAITTAGLAVPGCTGHTRIGQRPEPHAPVGAGAGQPAPERVVRRPAPVRARRRVGSPSRRRRHRIGRRGAGEPAATCGSARSSVTCRAATASSSRSTPHGAAGAVPLAAILSARSAPSRFVRLATPENLRYAAAAALAPAPPGATVLVTWREAIHDAYEAQRIPAVCYSHGLGTSRLEW